MNIEEPVVDKNNLKGLEERGWGQGEKLREERKRKANDVHGRRELIRNYLKKREAK